MLVLLALILLLISFRTVVGLMKFYRLNYEKYESIFCIIMYALIVLLAMFRGESVGADTADYIADYKGMTLMSFSDILDNYNNYQGYYVLNKVFSILGLPYYIWFAFVELVLVSALARFINKYSKDRLFSILLFVTTGLFIFSLAGLKQTLAMSLVFHSYLDFTEKRYLRVVILNLVAYTVHITALLGDVMLIFYLIHNNKKVFYPALVIVSAILLYTGTTVLSDLISFIGTERYEIYLQDGNHSYSASTLYLYLLVLMCILPFIRTYLNDNDIAKVALAGSVLLCAIQYLSLYSASLFRLAYSFIPFFLVFIPNPFATQKSTLPLQLFRILIILGVSFFCLYANRSLVYTFA